MEYKQNRIIESKHQPKSTNVTWIDLSGETPVEKHFINGRWVAVSSGGGGSIDISGKVDKVSGATPNNFASFDANGGIQDSLKNASNFATSEQGTKADNAIPMPTGGNNEQILAKDSSEAAGVKWVPKPSDGQDGADGLSAFQIAQQQGYTGTVDQWLASLKANIGEFLFVPTDAAAVTAMATIGQTYSSAIDPQGKNVSPSPDTLSTIVLMNDNATIPTKTMMIATQEVTPATTPASYEFVYAGDLQSAMPSNMLTDDKIDNSFAGGSGKVAGANEVKIISDTTMDIIECPNILNPQDIVVGKYISKDSGAEANIPITISCYGHTPLIKIPDAGCVVYNGMVSYGVCWRANIYGEGGINDFIEAKVIADRVLDKTGHDSWVYVIFNLAELPSNTEPSEYYAVYKGTTLPDTFIPYTPTTYKMKTPSVSFESGEKLEETVVTDGFVDDTESGKVADARQINKILDFETISGKNMLYMPWITGKKFDSSDGSIQTDSNTKYTIVPCEPSTNYYLSVSSGNITNYGAVVLIGSNGENVLSVVGPANHASMAISTDENTYYIGVTAQLNPTELQLEKGTSRTTYEDPFTPYKVPIVKTSVLPNNIIGDGSITTAKLANQAVTNDKIKEKTITINRLVDTEEVWLSKNVCNPSDCVFEANKYINKTNGNPATFTDSMLGGYTGFIKIDSEGLAFTNGLVYGSLIGGAAYYEDENGNKIYKRALNSKIVEYDGGDNTLSLDNPMHYPDAYVRFSINSSTTAENVMVNKGAVIKDYEPYVGKKVVISEEVLPPHGNSGVDKSEIALSTLGGNLRSINADSMSDSAIAFDVYSSQATVSYPKWFKRNASLAFSADISNLSEGWVIKVGVRSSESGDNQRYVKINSNDVVICACSGSTEASSPSQAHNMVLSNFIKVTFVYRNSTYKVTIASLGEIKTFTFTYGIAESYGLPFAEITNGSLSNVVLTAASSDLVKPIWVFGDSYTSLYSQRWTYYMLPSETNNDDYALIGKAGGGSAELLLDLKSALQTNTPKFLVWALGMNDGDTTTSVNTTWKSCFDEIVEICNGKGITFIGATIPNVPTVSNYYKNEVVRNSGYRYIDFAKAVGAEQIGSTWYEGLLETTTPRIHPTVAGAKVLASQVLLDFTEIVKLNE